MARKKEETAHERATRLRRERYAAKKADQLAEQAAALEQEGKADLVATKSSGPSPRELGTMGGSKSPTAVAKARDNLSLGFDLMGGVPGLVRWGRKNPTEFYRIWARLIPKEAVDATTQQPLENLLEQLASKAEKSVAEAAYEIGEETLARARDEVSIEDAVAAHKGSVH
jgi:hypothetical protein